MATHALTLALAALAGGCSLAALVLGDAWPVVACGVALPLSVAAAVQAQGNRNA